MRIRAVRIAEPRHRPAPVRLVAEAGDLLAGDPLAPRDEARAAPAGDDLGGQAPPRPRGPPRRVTLLEQEPVEPARDDEQPDEAHDQQVRDVDEQDRREVRRPSATRMQVDALVQRRQLDDHAAAPRDTSRSGRTCRRTGTAAGRRAGSGRSPASVRMNDVAAMPTAPNANPISSAAGTASTTHGEHDQPEDHHHDHEPDGVQRRRGSAPRRARRPRCRRPTAASTGSRRTSCCSSA